MATVTLSPDIRDVGPTHSQHFRAQIADCRIGDSVAATDWIVFKRACWWPVPGAVSGELEAMEQNMIKSD